MKERTIVKCQRCGAELEDGVLFCRECGEKVSRIRYCRECGAKLSGNSAFCDRCGAKFDTLGSQPQSAQNDHPRAAQRNLGNHGGTTPKHKSSKPIIIVAIVLLIGVLFYFFGADYLGIELPGKNSYEGETGDAEAPTNYTIEKGTRYAYMSDQWNVYIATAVSDEIIKIENWDKSSSDDKSVKLSAEIGTYMINDRVNRFSWVDDSHTAFIVKFSDKNNSRVRKAQTHTFTINTSDDDTFKGTNCDDRIACYTYTNDDWHRYRAIPLTENLVKIECWYKCNGFLFFGDYYNYAWDWCVIDINSTDTGFAWTDDEHTSFTITAQDTANKYYWKKPTLVVFELENPKYKYPTVKAYLKR